MPIRLLSAFAFLALLGYAPGDPAPAAPPEPQAPPAVTVVKPQRKTTRGALELPATIEAAEQVDLRSRIAGVVKEVRVDIGDRVKKGQVLAVLSAPEMEADLLRKKARVRVAQAEVEQVRQAMLVAEASIVLAEAEFDRALATIKGARASHDRQQLETRRLEVLAALNEVEKQLLEEARMQLAVARVTLVDAEATLRMREVARDQAVALRARHLADLKSAEARVEVTRADVQQVEALLQQTQIRAPFDGVVIRRNVAVGDYVAADDKAGPLFTIANFDTVRVAVPVAEADTARVQKDGPATLRVDALPGLGFKAKVTRIAAALDPATRTLRVELDLPNAEGKLRPGMYGVVTFPGEQREVWTLAAADVVTQGEQSFYYRVEGGKAIRTPVQIGRRFDEFVEVLKKQTRPGAWEDFTGEEQIIQSNLGLLASGQEVRVGAAGPGPREADLPALARAQVEVSRKAYEAARKSLDQTRRAEEVYTWSVRWLNAQRDVSNKKDERLAALEAHLQRMKDLEKRVEALHKGGRTSPLDPLAAEAYRVEAELWLAQEKAR
jgi:RND family efflux transporter MFP subunit